MDIVTPEINDTVPQFNGMLESLGYFFLGLIGILVSAIVYAWVSHLIKKRKDLTGQINTIVKDIAEIVSELKFIVSQVDEHKRYDENFRKEIKQEIAKSDKINKERYDALKEKLLTQCNEVKQMKSDLGNLISEHKMYHKYKKDEK